MKKKIKLKKKTKAFYDYSRDGVTQGLLAMWMECRQKARWFLQGYGSKFTSLALTYGTVGHGVLEQAYEHFRTGKNEGAPSKAKVRKYLGKVEKQWKLENPKPTKMMLQDLETSLAFAEVILPVYFKYWGSDFKKKKWKKIEGSFKIPITLPDGRKLFVRGKMDGMFRVKGLWLFESKFKSMLNENDIIDTLSLDLQVKLYLWAMWKLYGHIDIPSGVLYNIIRRFNLKQRQNENLLQFSKRCAEDLNSRPEWYFYRYEVATLKKDLEEFEQELVGMLTDFCDWWDGKTPHYRNPGSCIMKYGRCWGLTACVEKSPKSLNKRSVVFRELEDF